MSTPLITIFVRHSAECKYAGDEFCKRCQCRKHFRWTQNGEQHRRKAGTRSWVEAEEAKRRLEDQLAGRTPEPEPGQDGSQNIRDAIKAFLIEKELAGVSHDTREYQYRRELERMAAWMEGRGLYTVPMMTRTLLNEWMTTWTVRCPSTYSRRTMQIRLRTFLLFCFNNGWIERAPKLAPIKITAPPTQPLTEDEYKDLLAHSQGKVRTLIKLMRWSGLAIRDAALLRRTDLTSTGPNNYRIIRERQKTGADLYIPIPPELGRELVKVLNGNPEYIFWDRKQQTEDFPHTEQRGAQLWGQRVKRAFEAAGIQSEGHMISHRLRDTFAVDLLQKGVPLEHVSKLLGHKSVVTTENHYAKWVKGRQTLLDSIVSATWGK